MSANQDEGGASASLTIRELSARTGVPQPTLRTWESRYGAPAPQRLASGHRRYSADDVALVQEVVRLRAGGLGLGSAVERALGRTAEHVPSVYAALRDRHPTLVPQGLRKRTLLALTRAMEDQCAAQADSPVLFGAFQREPYFRQSGERWRDLARTARAAVAFADFGRHSTAGTAPVRIHLAPESPLRREWALVCDSPGYSAVVAGWERPGQRAADPDRLFETVWSVDPRVVRDAARTCLALAMQSAPELVSDLGADLDGSPPEASRDLQRASGLLDRMVRYLEQS